MHHGCREEVPTLSLSAGPSLLSMLQLFIILDKRDSALSYELNLFLKTFKLIIIQNRQFELFKIVFSHLSIWTCAYRGSTPQYVPFYGV